MTNRNNNTKDSDPSKTPFDQVYLTRYSVQLVLNKLESIALTEATELMDSMPDETDFEARTDLVAELARLAGVRATLEEISNELGLSQ